MDTEVDESAAPSSSERVLRHLETTVPECNLTILSISLLINSFEKADEAQVTGLLAESSSAIAHRATQCSIEAESEWEHVGTLQVELCRNWLLFDSHVAHLYLDLFCERGPTRPPQGFGRVCVCEVEQIMWPTWMPAFKNRMIANGDFLNPMRGGLSIAQCPCEGSPYWRRIVDVTLWGSLAEVSDAFMEVLRCGCIGFVVLEGAATLFLTVVIILIAVLGLVLSPGFLFFVCCLPALFVLLVNVCVVKCLLQILRDA